MTMDHVTGFYALNRPRFRRVFRRISAFSLLVFIFFFFGISGKSSSFSARIELVRKTESTVDDVLGLGGSSLNRRRKSPTFCPGIYDHQGYETQCDYLINSSQCDDDSGGFFNYAAFFYCDCDKNKGLAYAVLLLWLVALFYMLGNTATEYFCCCLEKLSNLLGLRPTVAGVTLLPLGNGAPDVFASIAAFMGTESGDVGLNSVLGGAMFVLSVVVGAIAICSGGNAARISKRCFFRDVGFFLFTLLALVVILVVGEVNFGGAIAYFSIYAVYALSVAANEIMRTKYKQQHPPPPSDSESLVLLPLLAHGENDAPLLETRLPHWIWNSHVGIYTNDSSEDGIDTTTSKTMWGWSEEETVVDSSPTFSWWWLLELPLALPRRLTIPIVEEERWSKGYAVSSAFLAPMLLALLWNSRQNVAAGSLSREVVYLIGAIVGVTLGIMSIIYTKGERPPTKFIFPWVMGGFFMSIVWFYIIANELVSLLVVLGVIFRIKPSILGLTVLAWGNSMGDLTSNLALAMNGDDGLQIAMSGCYAGPMFNTLVGLGMSMVLGAWAKSPGSFIVPKDSSLYLTIGFIALSLVWSCVALPRNGMRPSKVLGVGLVAIYLTFLSVRLFTALSAMPTDGS